MEARSIAFHREVRQAFLDFASAEPERYCVIDAEQPLVAVLAAATAAFEQQLVEAAS